MATRKEGWIYKQSSGVGKGWSKKYCILQYNLLLIFDKEPTASSRGNPKKTYNLSDCSIKPAEGLHKFGFQLNLPNSKHNVALAAVTKDDLREWTELIKEAGMPAPSVPSEEPQIPDRWEAPKPKQETKPSGSGPGNVADKTKLEQQQQYQQQQQQYQQPQYQAQYQQPQQQYQQQPQYQQPQYQAPPSYGYNPYQQAQFQQPPQAFSQVPPQKYQINPQYQQQPFSYQPQHTAPAPQQKSPYSDFLNAPAAPTHDPNLVFPTVPEQNSEASTQSGSELFPHIKELQKN